MCLLPFFPRGHQEMAHDTWLAQDFYWTALGWGTNLQRPRWVRLTSILHQASSQGRLSIRALAPVGLTLTLTLTPTLQGHCQTECRLGQGLQSCPHRPVSVVSHSESQAVRFEREIVVFAYPSGDRGLGLLQPVWY